MKNNTYQNRLIEIADNSANFYELMKNVQSVIDEIVNEDSRLFSVEKQWCGYGTWKLTCFVNEYRFGEELAEILRESYGLTHDEDKEYVIADLEEEITERIQNYAYSKF